MTHIYSQCLSDIDTYVMYARTSYRGIYTHFVYLEPTERERSHLVFVWVYDWFWMLCHIWCLCISFSAHGVCVVGCGFIVSCLPCLTAAETRQQLVCPPPSQAAYTNISFYWFLHLWLECVRFCRKPKWTVLITNLPSTSRLTYDIQQVVGWPWWISLKACVIGLH